ncbi:MAG: hypothetical protein ABIE47_00150, partial [Pseudomonadota bacterium]
DKRDQSWEIPVMNSHPASNLPDPFNRIEFGAIRWHEFQCQMPLAFFSPFEMHLGMMILDVVKDQDNVPPRVAAGSSYLLEKGEERFPIEAFFLPAVDEFAIPYTHSAKVADAFAGGMVQKNRIGNLRRNPHAASRTMLFKPDFVHSPQVDSMVMRQFIKFFYMLPAVPDQHAPSSDEVYETGNPDLERVAGTAECQGKHPIAVE